MRPSRFISGAILCAAIATAPACGASFSAGTSLSESKLESQLTNLLQEKTGTKPENVDCPEDLKPKKNATMTCIVTADGETHHLEVTVTEVRGSDIKYRYEVVKSTGDKNSTGSSVAKETVETKVADILEEEVGQRPEQVICPGDLPGKIGETMRCKLVAGTDELGLTVTVTSVDSNGARFDVEVDG